MSCLVVKTSLVLVAALALGCADEGARRPTPIAPEVLAAEHEDWRERRQRSLASPSGVVSWIGLWELAEGANPFGSDPALAIVLPGEDSPPLAGTLYLETVATVAESVPGTRGEREVEGAVDAGDLDPVPEPAWQLRLVPESASGLTLRDGTPVDGPIDVAHDRSGNTTFLTLGSLGLRVHAERGTDRLWLRAWDTDSPRAAAFELPPYFPVTNEWRLSARFDPYPEPREIPMADVTGGTVANVSPGELVFRAEGREHRLIAFATAPSRSYFVMVWDSTAVGDTYQLGRYMRVPPVDDGWTVIDFNRLYNPPCAFTPYSVCSFPPRENRLALAVRAGEKRPAEPAFRVVR
ncbi:MAG: DUF1684 domain-containing protein [Gemmatimonadota bacterium]|nr:DUF1684 domain-containing protein [Gemmatimonadota bacterium]